MDSVREPTTPRTPRLTWGDGLFLLFVASFWIVVVYPISVVERRHTFDLSRDIAAAVNMLAGNVQTDPALAGQTPWYPPLGPMLAAAAAWLIGAHPADVYITSSFYINWMILIGLYSATRLAFGVRPAWAAAVAVVLVLPWWQTHLAAAQPSWQALIGAWATLLLYGYAETRRSPAWAVLAGVVTAISVWHHPLLPGMLTLAIALRTGFATLAPGRPDTTGPGDTRGRMLSRAAGMLAPPLISLALFAWLIQYGPVLNDAPRTYLAPEMFTARFAWVDWHVPFWTLTALGLVVAVARRSLHDQLLICILAISAGGQLGGFAHYYDGHDWPAIAWLPVIVPHQFQMHGQIALAIAFGIGLDAAFAWAERRVGLAATSRISRGAFALALVLLGYPGLKSAVHHAGAYMNDYRPTRPYERAAAWIRNNTDVHDVFALDALLAFHWLNPATGRKVWLVPIGHSNPRVDWHARRAILRQLEVAPSAAAFAALARQHGIGYVIPSPGWHPRALAEPDLLNALLEDHADVVFHADGLPIVRLRAPSANGTESRKPAGRRLVQPRVWLEVSRARGRPGLSV